MLEVPALDAKLDAEMNSEVTRQPGLQRQWAGQGRG